MDKKQFYPTPYKLARKMVDILCGEKYHLGNNTVLEPSAGDGAILDLLTNRRVRKENIICCEVDYDRQTILRSKGYNLVGFDFLLDDIPYTPHRIIMNPPFRQGVAHVVKAWNMLAEGGRLVAIINAANLRVSNPSFETHVLIKAISEYGSVEYLKDEFTDKLSRRKTKVEVALITLNKPKAEKEDFLNHGFERIKEAIETEENQTSSALVVKAIIPQLVARYNASVSAFKTMEKAISEFRLVSNVFNYRGDAGDVKIQKPSYNEFVRNLTKQAWEQIFEKSDFRNMVTQKVKDELNQHFDSCSTIAFNERNIVALLEQLAVRYDSLMEDCLVESFNNFTSTHKENREHKEGWITNSQWLLTRKLIYPAYYPNRYDSRFSIAYERQDVFDDLDRALCYLAGKKMNEIVSIRRAVRAEKQSREDYNKSDEATEHKSLFSMKTRSTFFLIKTHKKGTIWLTFDYTLDNGDDIRDRFNYIVAQKLGFPLRGKDFKDRK